jgi:7,8-dihydropterin-6-yl-methyl-4-(beta-D-ribofuranosyl)aminobenzene 5'-phosphate synthase
MHPKTQEVTMPFRISPAWWPLIGLSSPVLFPMLVARNRRYKQNVIRSERENRERIERAEPLELPELERFELTVILEHKAEPGYLGAPGICYLIRTDQGSVLFDLGFGPEQPALMHNATQLNFSMD